MQDSGSRIQREGSAELTWILAIQRISVGQNYHLLIELLADVLNGMGLIIREQSYGAKTDRYFALA